MAEPVEILREVLRMAKDARGGEFLTVLERAKAFVESVDSGEVIVTVANAPLADHLPDEDGRHPYRRSRE